MSSDNKTTSSFTQQVQVLHSLQVLIYQQTGILVRDTPPSVAFQHMTDLHIGTNSSFETRHVVSNNVTF